MGLNLQLTMLIGVVSNISAARFCLYLNNQRSYRHTEGTGGFGASNRSRNTASQNSEDSCELLHRR
jgi:hypothetical protein